MSSDAPARAAPRGGHPAARADRRLDARLLWARGELAGSDAYAYWTAVQRWCVGAGHLPGPPGSYVPPTQGALPYRYAPWSLYLLAAVGGAALGHRLDRVARVPISSLFAASVAWAYRPTAARHGGARRAVRRPALAANFDTGNVNVFIVLGMWVAYWAGARAAAGWPGPLGAALKFLPSPLLPFMPRRSWRWGLVVFGVLAVLTLATWPETVRQLDIVLNYPRPLRVDYLMILWGLVPWLYSRPWPPRLSWSWLREAPPPSA